MKLRYKIVAGILGIMTFAIITLALVIGHTEDCPPAVEQTMHGQPMKAVVARCYGSPGILELVELDKPVPANDELLIKVHAASVNPLDWHAMRGSPYIMRLSSGLGAPTASHAGVDFAGTIEAVGKDVSRFKPGDEVFGGAGGAFAQYLTVRDSRAVVHKPANISFEQAATVPIAAISALQALRDKGQLKSGQKVLINGASGGVGTFAVQIAKAMGAEVTGVCSTRNVAMVRSIGADHVFDYKKEDYTRSGQQYDLIIDNVGNHSPLANIGVLNANGRYVIVGGPKGNWLGPMMGAIKSLMLSPFVGQEMIMLLAQMNKADLTSLANLLKTGKITPVIDRRYSLSDLPAAINYSEQGHVRGKISITVP